MPLYVGIISMLLIIASISLPFSFLSMKVYEKFYQERPQGRDLLNCLIPIYCMYYIRHIIYDDAKSYKIFSVTSYIYLILLLVVRFIVPYNTSWGILINTAFVGISLIFVIALYIYTVYMLYDLCQYYEAPERIVYSFLGPPIAAYKLINSIEYYYRKHPDEEVGTFDAK